MKNLESTLRRMDAQSMAGTAGSRGGRGRARVVQVRVIETEQAKVETTVVDGEVRQELVTDASGLHGYIRGRLSFPMGPEAA